MLVYKNQRWREMVFRSYEGLPGLHLLGPETAGPACWIIGQMAKATISSWPTLTTLLWPFPIFTGSYQGAFKDLWLQGSFLLWSFNDSLVIGALAIPAGCRFHFFPVNEEATQEVVKQILFSSWKSEFPVEWQELHRSKQFYFPQM